MMATYTSLVMFAFGPFLAWRSFDGRPDVEWKKINYFKIVEQHCQSSFPTNAAAVG